MRHPAFHVRGCVPVCVLSTSIMAAAGGGEGEAVSSQAAADAVLAMASFGCVLFATPAQRAAHYRLIPAITDGMLLAALEERWGRVWPSLRADVDKARVPGGGVDRAPGTSSDVAPFVPTFEPALV